MGTFGTVIVIVGSFLLWKHQKSKNKISATRKDQTFNSRLSKNVSSEKNVEETERPVSADEPFEPRSSQKMPSIDDFDREFSKSKIDRRQSLVDGKEKNSTYSQVPNNNEPTVSITTKPKK